ncbi:DUF1534 domain-containing protein [Pseudomonas syringae]|uniref:DUF1534 domain-containing protein n=1 Tax=Pseudomonas syringae TaxID=317 RepID=A0A9Q4FJ26_PSESX|nr:DUF1534 domain-containing protein [Pseudomonas syringae]MCF5475171.1 DUF1534 domain-containing protein [Pseudomonas syringae]MCF5484697.1 DUF1534 domain-containing protein [Pseudomonas syringae]MCF5489729.1 DUF1534 domain-containing protein [Pseudomonas syringae]MCF5493109.1 DUF1534 domain-containing protein [Pseudomonas syringae]
MHAHAERWHDRVQTIIVPHAPAWECSSGRSASNLECATRSIATIGFRRLSFRTLQRGNAVLDALRPLLRALISAAD